MGLGNKILELRKKKGYSQEELAEKLSITRQTISKWELDETSPDIKQAKELSKIFNISLDDLLENDVKNILTEKISNTERLAGLIINILKFIGIFILVVFLLVIISIFLFMAVRTEMSKKNSKVMTIETIICNLDNQSYTLGIKYNENNEIVEIGGDFSLQNLLDLEQYKYADQVKENLSEYFKRNGGGCKIE
ncbi:MAG: helix-turn-helix transcriptional regulator [Bacilli bacterium]